MCSEFFSLKSSSTRPFGTRVSKGLVMQATRFFLARPNCWLVVVECIDYSCVCSYLCCKNGKMGDSYCMELLSMLLSLSGSASGAAYLAQQMELLEALVTLLHTTTDAVQLEVQCWRVACLSICHLHFYVYYVAEVSNL